MWANVSRAGAWAMPMRVGKEHNYVSAVLAELMTDERWSTREECFALLGGSVNAMVLERALCWLTRIGAAETRGNVYYKLNGSLFADRFKKIRSLQEKKKNEDEDIYVCATCEKAYTMLDAVSLLRMDKFGFFCTCGGDLHIKTHIETEDEQTTALMQPVLRIIEQAESSGQLPPKIEAPIVLHKRKIKSISSSTPLKQSRNL